MSNAGGTGGQVVERCSACGRSAAQVTKLLTGRAQGSPVIICDKCVRECERAIGDSPTRIPGGAHSCAFCMKMDDQVAVIIGVGAKKICDECVDVFRAALD
ncbi:MAG TPA: ClpX C4-type zinc finger protein [Labilithrix sp.]|nr:ClpX C4-type zinc finger protein [Labilithrix sp.]